MGLGGGLGTFFFCWKETAAKADVWKRTLMNGSEKILNNVFQCNNN
jgi:hypothetical protein